MLLCFILLRCLDSVAQFSANNTFVPWCFIIINRHRATADLLRGIPGLSRDYPGTIPGLSRDTRDTPKYLKKGFPYTVRGVLLQ